MSFAVKERAGDENTKISKSDSDFGKSQAAGGIVSVDLSTTDLDMVGEFTGELRTQISSSDIDKSSNIDIRIEEAVTD